MGVGDWALRNTSSLWGDRATRELCSCGGCSHTRALCMCGRCSHQLPGSDLLEDSLRVWRGQRPLKAFEIDFRALGSSCHPGDRLFPTRIPSALGPLQCGSKRYRSHYARIPAQCNGNEMLSAQEQCSGTAYPAGWAGPRMRERGNCFPVMRAQQSKCTPTLSCVADK